MVLDFFLSLIEQGSYFAVFITSFLASSTLLVPIVPIPSYAPVLIGVGIGLNPLATALLGGLGSALGELIGYFAGMGGSAAIEKFERRIPKFLKWIEKFYTNIGFWVVMICAFLPFPFDIIGILSGVSKYDLKKFMIALLIGRIVRSLIIAYTGYWTVPFLINLFS